MRFNNIKVIVIDVDGTLTDGLYNVSTSGDLSKTFYTRDFYAMREAQEAGLRIVLSTSAKDNVIDEKLKQAELDNIFRYKDHFKFERLEFEMEPGGGLYGTSWENIAYIGDAENDLKSMKRAAFTACPNDALSIVKEEANFISDFNGGRGAVHEIINYILNNRTKK